LVNLSSRDFFYFSVLLMVFAVVGILMSRPGIDNPWFWDDLHWFRSFSLSELASTWHGTNDPQGLLVPGYRPLHAASNHFRYELFGESPSANRYFSVGSLSLAFALLVYGLRTFGISLSIGVSAALLALTSKNLTYTYAWVSDGYQALQMAAFGGTVLALGLGLRTARHHRLLLGLSVAMWMLTLLLKDQGILLLPVLIILAVIGALGGFEGLAARMSEVSLRSLGGSLVYGWTSSRVRLYSLIVSAIAVADAVARAVFVPSATPSGPSLHGFVLTLTQTVTFPGSEKFSSALAYSAIALGLFCVVIVSAYSGRVIGTDRITPWLIALFAMVCVAFTVVYGFHFGRADLVYFPMFFYGVFVSASLVVFARMLRGRGLVLFAGGTALIALVTVTASVRASIKLQRSMSRSSVQTLARNYEFTYGKYAAAARIPARRRANVEAELARVGIRGRLPHHAVFTYLYCQATRDPAFPGRIPEMFFGGRKAFPTARCGP
jgi:hypothetical protein